MQGRMPTQRHLPPGPHPDWREVEWYVYDDVVTVGGREYHCCRVSPRRLSVGELRRFERLVAVVGRCPLKRVRELLKAGYKPEAIQGIVDRDAEVQARRSAEREPNTYRELLERLKPNGATQEAA